MTIPFLTQTIYNESRSIKFCFIIYPQEAWIDFIKEGKFLDYIINSLEYITEDNEFWYTLRIKKTKYDKYISFDNKTSNIIYDEIPRLFVEAKLMKDKDKFDCFIDYFITGKKLDKDNVEYIKFNHEEVIDIINNSD